MIEKLKTLLKMERLLQILLTITINTNALKQINVTIDQA